MVATDGVYFRSQHPGLTISEDLGEWSEEHKNNLTVFKPGMYWDDKTRSDLAAKKAAPRFKSRGVNAGAFSVTIADMDTAFKTLDGYPGKSDWPVSKFIVPFSMITPIQALQRHDWSLAGQTGPIDSTHNSDPSKKRDAGEIENGIIHSRVKHFDRLATGHCPPALPYDKSMSVRSMVLEADMLPDDERLTPDGRVLDYIRLELGME